MKMYRETYQVENPATGKTETRVAEWNVAGIRRQHGRGETILRWHCLIRDSFTCQLGDACFACRANGTAGMRQDPDSLQIDHVRPFAANGLASLAFSYGPAERDASGALVKYVPDGKRTTRLVVAATPKLGGIETLVSVYGPEHINRVLDPDYSAEYDPMGCLTVCAEWNQAFRERVKPNEKSLLCLAADRQATFGQWDYAAARSVRVPTYRAAMSLRDGLRAGRARMAVPTLSYGRITLDPLS